MQMDQNQKVFHGYKINYYEICKKINYLTVFSLILLMFFFRFHYKDFSILFENFTISLFIIVAGMRFILLPISVDFVKIILIFFLITVTHAFLIANVSLFNEIKFIRYFGFISIFFSFGFSIFLIKLFRNYLYNTCLYVFIFGILVFLFFPYPVSIVDSYYSGEVIRLKFFFSEPSSTAAFCGLLTIYSIEKKKILILFLVFTVIVFSGSNIALIITLISILYSLKLRNLIFVLLFFLIFVFILIQFDNWISYRIIKKYNFLVESEIYNLYDFFINFNGRSKNLALAFEKMHDENFLFIGFGLNQNIYNVGEDRIASLGLGHHILISFGLIGLILFLILSIIMCIKFYQTQYTFLMPFILGAIVNSAQGLLLQGIWFTALGLLINLYIRKNKKFEML